MSDEACSLVERLAQAKRSNNLRHKAGRCDIDIIGASALGARRNVEGHALLELDLTLDPGLIPEARRAATRITRDLAGREGWTMSTMKLKKIADTAIKFYFDPACKTCSGRRHTGLDRDKPATAARVASCPSCHGTGKQPLPIKYNREVRAVISRMLQARRQAGGQIRKALGVRADLD